ncbi:putative protein serine/threonine phosphatase [Piscirickettsia salmonis]|nr:putative protein serine/threonine phosphatase [Piscirickettsia salmonis]QGO85303.1 putative protein serine/threonine phosphatase [Piscirickettsia salmonis]QGO88815.1 putative protein serine/threonine phosphatase [Piscirickettsia salmonis]QGO95797.1 putative protein serine/threonine phosphatase [Piscirickettsia salmonis]QGO99290.1 putative protein serine/threonine phosphatase [Piscirickettsia salmonis]
MLSLNRSEFGGVNMGHHGKPKRGFFRGIFSRSRRSPVYSEDHQQDSYVRPVRMETAQLTERCQACQADNPAHSKFCGQCGVSLVSQTLQCQGCQARVKAPARFCPECGVAFKANP